MKNNKGFTLIELIVVLGLTAVVIAVVMSFFIANFKSYETINTESELQYQSQYIINFMTNKILEAEGYDGSEFIYKLGADDDTTEKFSFILDDYKIVFKDTDGKEITVGKYVEDFKINTVSGDPTKVKIELTLKGKKDYTATQIVYMRNSKN